jgi:hypothetical protein
LRCFFAPMVCELCSSSPLQRLHASSTSILPPTQNTPSQIRAEWACAEKGAASTCEALTALAESQSVGLLVVGSFGRKGEKTFDMLGTVSDYSLRQSNCSVCVVRSTSPPAAAGGGGREYLFATDGSKAAALGFCSLVRQ